MPAPDECTICEHTDRALIEAALAAGTPSLRTTADRHKVSKTAMLRHREKHMSGVVRTAAEVVRARVDAAAPVQLARATGELVKVRAERLVEDAENARDMARRLAERAVEEGIDIADAARVVKTWVDANGGGVSKALQLLGMATGEIRAGSQTLVLVEGGRVVHPELGRVMDCVMGALAAYPEAGAAVVRALEEMAGEAG